MKKLKIVILIIIICLLGYSGYSIYSSVNKNSKSVKKVKTIDSISNYDYSISNNSTSYYKDLFKELKNILKSNEINDEEYAKKIAQLYVTDLFTLSNKLSSSDIGGIQYIYKDYQEDYISTAQSSLYSSVQSNIYGDRKQELPEVKNVIINSCTKTSFKIGKQANDDSYSISLKIEYVKDMSYPSDYNLIVSKIDNKMYIVKSGK